MTGELVQDDNGPLPLSSLSVRIQKKIAGRLASSKVLTKQLLTEKENAVFLSLHALLMKCVPKEQTDKVFCVMSFPPLRDDSGEENRASKVFLYKLYEMLVKAVMKLTLKMTIIARNGLVEEDWGYERLHKLQRHLQQLAYTVISFARVSYSYERAYLLTLLKGLREELAPLVVLQLSDKSSSRLSFVFDSICSTAILDDLFSPASSVQLKALADVLETLF